MWAADILERKETQIAKDLRIAKVDGVIKERERKAMIAGNIRICDIEHHSTERRLSDDIGCSCDVCRSDDAMRL
ncbi:hypothetical protein CDAR_27501 [Caerostris darwini]|uniref:Uncharacterized protein n=1 Tax=Caerostris darwini TaxID=1538125 RepID=A0AAV4VTY2_9ARAC|nr:hypothetical protein CDAR_27501 [Caerostris darwini]